MEDTGNYKIKNIISSSHINFLFGADVNGRAFPQLNGFKDTIKLLSSFVGQDPAFLDVLEKHFMTFFEEDVVSNPLKAEYLLPTLIGSLLRENKCTVKVLETHDKWFGVAYKEDKEEVVQSFKKLIEEGVYQEELYSDLQSQ